MEVFLWLILVAVPALMWAFVVWRRIYRLARYFQLEGYESKRYLRWFVRQRYELQYLLGNFLSICAKILAVVLTVENPNVGVEARAVFLVSLIAIDWIFALLNLIFLPREHDIKQKFAATQRAMRLLATAVIISLAILFVVSKSFITLEHTNIQSMFVAWYYSWILFGGALAVLLTPLALPLANIINFPLEEVIQRYDFARGKR